MICNVLRMINDIDVLIKERISYNDEDFFIEDLKKLKYKLYTRICQQCESLKACEVKEIKNEK